MIFINQLREKIGVMYGNPYTTPGGRALKHFYNTRIQFKTGTPIEIGSGAKKDRIGWEISMQTIKNKKGTPYRKAVVDFYFTGQVGHKKSLLFSAVKYGIIKRAGAYYSYGKVKEQGQEKFCDKLTDKQWEEIKKEIWQRIK